MMNDLKEQVMKLPRNAGAVAILKSGFGNPAESEENIFSSLLRIA